MCPGAPFLIGGTADQIADHLHPVVQACADAISGLPAADGLLLISAGSAVRVAAPGTVSTGAAEGWRLVPPGTLISTSPVRRSDLPNTPPVRLSPGQGADTAAGTSTGTGTAAVDAVPIDAVSVGTMVGAWLLATTAAQPVPPSTAVEIIGDPAQVAGMLAEQVNATDRIALLVIADGAACHGDHAPGRRDDRAADFDSALAAALAAGDPAALAVACGDRNLARELLATVDPLAVLARLTRSRPPRAATMSYAAAPLGVGYLVAAWYWDRE